MNYYLDVDGTILTKDQHEAEHLYSFLSFLLETGNVRWLTTHCREEDTMHVLMHLKRSLHPMNYELVTRIRGTRWQTLKTEAINFSQAFIWFDDYLLEAEKIVLKEQGCLENWIAIDLPRFGNNVCRAINETSAMTIPMKSSSM